MQVQVNTDRNIEGSEALSSDVASTVEGVLGHATEHITRVEVHLSDQNSSKKGGGNDIRCNMEARLKGLQPTSVSHEGENIHEAVAGAADKLSRSVSHTLGRLRGRRNRPNPPIP